jgi:hypothetical protein
LKAIPGHDGKDCAPPYETKSMAPQECVYMENHGHQKTQWE